MRKKSEQNKDSQKNKTASKKQQKNTEQISKTDGKIKKKISGFAKLKNQLEHTVNAKKIIQLIKKGTKTIPHLLTMQQSKPLLPKLEKITLPQQNQRDGRKRMSQFEEIEGQLTQSMVMFKKSAQLQRNDLWAIDIQTQKCYKMIPSFYFKQHMNSQQLTRNLILTKNNVEMKQNILILGDYLDQVQFNINQQAGAKIKMFMNFIFCMNTIQDLVVINAKKLNTTRKHTGILRDIIVSRSIRINQQRLRKQNIEQTLEILNIFKRLKILENKLNAQIAVGNFISHDSKSKLGALFNEYCEIHNVQLRKFCCKTGKSLCRYWDITYFVERGFQDNFMKMIKSYLFELINCQKEIQNYKKALNVRKKNFMTTPSNSSHNDTSFNILDQSYEVDAFDHVELITKIHIEKEIISMFEQGMNKYSYSTENLQIELKQFISGYVNTFLKDILSSIQSESKITFNLNENKDLSYFESERCKQKIVKISWTQFDKIVEMIISRFEYLSTRLLSIVEKIILKAKDLEEEFPERYQVICAYFVQLIRTLMLETDFFISGILKERIKFNQKTINLFKSKQQIFKQSDNQCDNLKKLVKHCKKWLNHTQSLEKSYKLCKCQLQNLSNKTNNKTENKASVWSPKVEHLKGTLVKNNYELFHKTLTSRTLRQKLQEDNWQLTQIKMQVYNDLGYIIGGKQFLVEEERMQRDSLSKSILIDRSQSQIEKTIILGHSPQYNKQQYSSKFKINPTYITLGSAKFKIIASTQHLIKILRKYLQLYDDLIEIDKKSDLQAKITQLILMYNQYVRDLILKAQALKLGRVKTKTITAKLYVVTFIQLQFINLIFSSEIIRKRVGFTKEDCSVMWERITATQNDVKRKFQKIIQMRIQDTITGFNITQNGLQTQQLSDVCKNIQSSIQLFSDLLINQKQFRGFLDIDANWTALLLNKINKLSNSKEVKLKSFTFLLEVFQQWKNYLPRVYTAVKSALN